VAVSIAKARLNLLEQVLSPEAGAWFADEAASAVATAIGFDGWCLFAVDPLTGIRTVMFSRDALECPQDRIIYNETVEHDFNRFADLAAGPRPVGLLATAGPSAPRSPRLHEILVPEGFHSELRLVLVSEGRYWGALTLYRDDPRRPFSDAEATGAVMLSDALTQVVRRYHVGVADGTVATRPAGLVLFDPSMRLLSISPEAHEWLAAMAVSWPSGVNEGDVIRMVYEVARATAGRSSSPLCRVRIPGGGWLVASGTLVEAGDVGVAVVLAAADSRTTAPAFAAWCGLTSRETQVLAGLADGLVTKMLARSLSISPQTVDDHLKSIYRKAHVRGRDELLALVR
jgi:DNA-binding CsgD family transcriptional regulator